MWKSSEYQILAKKIASLNAAKVLFCSAEEKVGKTFLLVNLSKILIEDFGVKVRLVDLNFRNQFDQDELLSSIELDKHPKFKLVSFENKDQVELDSVLKSVEGEITLIDSSPINAFNQNNIHPVLLSGFSDNVLLVVNKNSTKKRDLKIAKSLFDQEGVEINDFVLNNCPIKNDQDNTSVLKLRSTAQQIIQIGKSYYQRLKALHG